MIGGERKEKKKKQREETKRGKTGDDQEEQVSIQLGRWPASLLPSGHHPNGQS